MLLMISNCQRIRHVVHDDRSIRCFVHALNYLDIFTQDFRNPILQGVPASAPLTPSEGM